MEKGYKTTNLISQTIIHKYDFSNVWCEILIKHIHSVVVKASVLCLH